MKLEWKSKLLEELTKVIEQKGGVKTTHLLIRCCVSVLSAAFEQLTLLRLLLFLPYLPQAFAIMSIMQCQSNSCKVAYNVPGACFLGSQLPSLKLIWLVLAHDCWESTSSSSTLV